MKYFPEAHTAVQMKVTLDGMIESLQLTEEKLKKYAVNDNAANAKAAIRLSQYLHQYLCDNHTMQLAVGDTFKASVSGARMTEVLAKSKDLAKLTHTSGPALKELREACKSVGIKFTKLKNPNETRWNSSHTNMKSVLKLKPALEKLFRDDVDDKWSTRELTATEWKLLQGAVEVLEEVVLVTKAWEVEEEPTMNGVLEQIYNLTSKLENFIACPQKCR